MHILSEIKKDHQSHSCNNCTNHNDFCVPMKTVYDRHIFCIVGGFKTKFHAVFFKLKLNTCVYMQQSQDMCCITHWVLNNAALSYLRNGCAQPLLQ